MKGLIKKIKQLFLQERIGRLDFLIGHILWFGVFLFCVFLVTCDAFEEVPREFFMNALKFIPKLIAIGLYVGSIIFMIRLMIARFHDLNKSGFWYFTLMIPIVDIFITIMLYFFRGTKGENKYGPDPLEKSKQDQKEKEKTGAEKEIEIALEQLSSKKSEKEKNKKSTSRGLEGLVNSDTKEK